MNNWQRLSEVDLSKRTLDVPTQPSSIWQPMKTLSQPAHLLAWIALAILPTAALAADNPSKPDPKKRRSSSLQRLREGCPGRSAPHRFYA